MLTEFFMINSWNYLHILNLLFYPVFGVSCHFIFRKKGTKAKDIFMIVCLALCFLSTWGIFIFSLFESEYQRIHFWARLPLHMCSINAVFYPVIFLLIKRNKLKPLYATTLMAYMYFVGSPGALLAMIMPAGDCINTSFLNYNVLSFWVKHGLIFMIPILMVSLGYYKPKLIDTLKASVFLLFLLIFMHGVNLLFSWFSDLSGAHDVVNFFYTRSAEGNFLLEIFWNLVPYELLYMLPLVVIAVPIFMIYYLPILISNKVVAKIALKNSNK